MSDIVYSVHHSDLLVFFLNPMSHTPLQSDDQIRSPQRLNKIKRGSVEQVVVTAMEAGSEATIDIHHFTPPSVILDLS